MIDYETNSIHQAPVVQRVDNAIIWINFSPADNVIVSPNTDPLDSDLTGRYIVLSSVSTARASTIKTVRGTVWEVCILILRLIVLKLFSFFFFLFTGRNRRWNSDYDRW